MTLSDVTSLFSDVKPALCYLDEDKFYYDFEKRNPFTPDDVNKIERKMQELLTKGEKIRKIKSSLIKDNKYKEEILKEIKNTRTYQINDYKDVLLGELLEQVPKNSAFKLPLA